MKFERFTLISKIDANDTIEIEVDLDTIDDDEPTINLISESLDLNDDGLPCPNTQEFLDAYIDDDLFLQIIWDIHDKPEGYKFEREKYIIKVGGLFD